MDQLRNAIIRTLAFNAAWGYAPTRLQLALNLDVGAVGAETPSEGVSTLDIPDVWAELDRLMAEGLVIESQAHVALAPYAEQIAQGRAKEFYFPRKLRRAHLAAAYLSRLPWIRAVCLCNTTALGQARDQGDLDFLIIAKAGSLWRTRFFATLPFKLLDARPHDSPQNSVIPALRPPYGGPVGIQNPEKKKRILGSHQTRPRMTRGKDPVCLSFFVTDDALDLSRFILPGNDGDGLGQDRAGSDDPYLRYWFLSLLPLYEDGVLKDLWERNGHLRQRHVLARRWMALDGDDFPKAQKKGPVVSSWLENGLKALQKDKFPDSIKIMANQDTRVVIDDQALKFHVDDQRQDYRKRYYEICREYGVAP